MLGHSILFYCSVNHLNVKSKPIISCCNMHHQYHNRPIVGCNDEVLHRLSIGNTYNGHKQYLCSEGWLYRFHPDKLIIRDLRIHHTYLSGIIVKCFTS